MRTSPYPISPAWYAMGDGLWRHMGRHLLVFRAGRYWRCGDGVHRSRGPYRTMRGAMRAAVAIRWEKIGFDEPVRPDRKISWKGQSV